MTENANLSDLAARFFRNFQNSEPDEVSPLKLSGSARRYFRLRQGKKTYILCVSQNRKENSTFIILDRYLRGAGIPVPEIYWVSENGEAYIQEDLGDLDLLRYLHGPDNDTQKWRVIKEVIINLVKMQRLPKSEWQDKVEFPPLDRELIRYDFNYALTNFFSVSGCDYDEMALRRDFETLENRLMNCPEELWGLMYRDFQSRNIMLSPAPVFIDFQSARRGPGVYDLVSFAWQAKAGFSMKEREEIIDLYVNELKRANVEQAEDVRLRVGYWALFRILQTLGAYGLRGLKEGKTHFIESIPPALKNLKELIERYNFKQEFPELSELGDALLKETRYGR